MAPSKRQTTMAKLQREQAVREKRARKQERKDEKKQAAADQAYLEANPPEVTDEDETGEGDGAEETAPETDAVTASAES